MIVRARFFASHRERLGTDRLELKLPDGASIADLVGRLVGLCPDVLPVLKAARFAVNREYVPETTVLSPGDEVAFIPPVAGGGIPGW